MSGRSGPVNDGMPPRNHIGANGNIAKDHATQNITFIFPYFERSLSKDDQADLTKVLSPMIMPFFQSVVPHPSEAARSTESLTKEAPDKGLRLEETASNGDDSPCRNNSKSDGENPEDFFSALQPFRNELTDAYKRTRGNGFIKTLEREFQLRIKSWLELGESKIFPVHMHDERRLILEMVRSVGYIIEQAPFIAQVVHLCHENYRKKSAQPRILVLDLLFQILQHQRRFGRSLTSLKDLTTAKGDDVDSLWRVFEKCVIEAGIKTLFIFLDRVDTLYDTCTNSTAGKEQFSCFLTNLTILLCQKDIVVKVMVTSRESKVAAIFTGPKSGFK